MTEFRFKHPFEVQDLVTKEMSGAHSRRLKHFGNSDFEVTDDVLHHLDYQKGELRVIESFDDISDKDGQIKWLVKWKGFWQDENDWLSESLLRKYVPDLFHEYLVDISKNETQRQLEVANRLL